jgi:hypothetical protein
VNSVAACYRQITAWGDEDLALSFDEAARYCQLNLADLDALAAAGLLRGACGPFRLGSARWLCSERALYRSLRALLGRVPVRRLADAPGPILDLAGVLAVATEPQVGIAPVLCAARWRGAGVSDAAYRTAV